MSNNTNDDKGKEESSSENNIPKKSNRKNSKNPKKKGKKNFVDMTFNGLNVWNDPTLIFTKEYQRMAKLNKFGQGLVSAVTCTKVSSKQAMGFMKRLAFKLEKVKKPSTEAFYLSNENFNEIKEVQKRFEDLNVKGSDEEIDSFEKWFSLTQTVLLEGDSIKEEFVKSLKEKASTAKNPLRTFRF